jgi:hypothetical protein
MINLQAVTLSTVPKAEDGTFEFKSSATPPEKLREKINRAASGFANSGGGCFLAGVDDSGNADGGLPRTIGRQRLSDWADQAIQGVAPPVAYKTREIGDADGRGILDNGRVILAIFFHPSELAPHMASNSVYYIRAGAHTVPASAFIVESLWARRSLRKPMLSHAVRTKPGNPEIVQIGAVALNSAPALDVEFNITPLRGHLAEVAKYFPIHLPIVDENTPFFLDSSLYHEFYKEYDDEVVVFLRYNDVAGNSYEYRSSRPLREAISPKRLGTEPAEIIAKAIRELSKR